MAKPIFVSHASEDATLVDDFINTVLIDGCALPREAIFFTTRQGMGIGSGEDLVSQLRDEVARAQLIIAIVTPAYSAFSRLGFMPTGERRASESYPRQQLVQFVGETSRVRSLARETLRS